MEAMKKDIQIIRFSVSGCGVLFSKREPRLGGNEHHSGATLFQIA